MANKPPVLRVIFFLLADHIAIFIQNILHVAVQAFQLAAVERKTAGRGPREIVRTDNITVQWQLETFIRQFTQIGFYTGKSQNRRQGTVDQQISRLGHIGFHRTSQTIIE